MNIDSNTIRINSIDDLKPGHLYKLRTTNEYISIPIDRCFYLMDDSNNLIDITNDSTKIKNDNINETYSFVALKFHKTKISPERDIPIFKIRKHIKNKSFVHIGKLENHIDKLNQNY